MAEQAGVCGEKFRVFPNVVNSRRNSRPRPSISAHPKGREVEMMKRNAARVRSVRLTIGLALAFLCMAPGCADRKLGGEGACEERIALFQERMALLNSESYSIAADFELPSLDAGTRIAEEHPRIDLGITGQSMNGSVLSESLALERYDLVRRNWNILHARREAPPLHLRAAADAPIADRLAFLQDLGERGAFHLVVMGPPSPNRFPFEGTPEHVLSRLQDTPAREEDTARDGTAETVAVTAMTGVLSMVDEAVASCPPAIVAQGSVVELSLRTRYVEASETMAQAARSCGCRDIDVDLLEAALFKASRMSGHRHRVLQTPLSAAEHSTRITLASDATFGDLARAIARREAEGSRSPVWIDLAVSGSEDVALPGEAPNTLGD